MAECIALAVLEDIKGAEVCIDIHASNIFLREIPQVRISEQTAAELVPMAKLLNVDFVWFHSAATVLKSTLVHSLNMVGTKTLVAEMGVGMRITKEYGRQLCDGILSLMQHLGMWDGDIAPVREGIVFFRHSDPMVYSGTVVFKIIPRSVFKNSTKQPC